MSSDLIESVRRNRDFYNKEILNQQLSLERAKVSNEELETLKGQQFEAATLLERAHEYKMSISKINAMGITEDNAFKKRRISYLDQLITEELFKVFPEEGYLAHVSCDFKNRSNKAHLILTDSAKNVRMPSMTEGKLCQYLISFSATTGAVKGLGKNNLYVDEAFGASDPDNLVKVGKMLKQTVEGGMQVVLISQNSILYQDVPRREFRLARDHEHNSIYLRGVVDL